MSISHEAPRTKLTYDLYRLFPEDGNRHEIIHGRHYMNPAPNLRHQTVSRMLQFQLIQAIELQGLGQVFNAPVDLKLEDVSVVQPDLVVVLTGNEILTKACIDGVPDLVVEILSPSTRARDLDLKKRLYEQFGVPEYWIVDGDEEKIVQNRLQPPGEYVAQTVSESIVYEGLTPRVTVDLQRVWSA